MTFFLILLCFHRSEATKLRLLLLVIEKYINNNYIGEQKRETFSRFMTARPTK